ncbi:MAG: fibronectin type III-like domain-contianing protein, partial [Prevotella sp.]|nr:fibronectin type III-like domain-contianing protein [Prevotella sp.]
LFPFGYGLSYTTFEYGKAKVEVSEGAWTVSVPVTNTGSVKGKEVVQLYVGDDKASVIRPKKELKAFEKIEINPGETKTAKLTITEQDLKFWDEAKHEWTLEPGTFTFYVAASSADIKQKIKVKK